MSSGLVVTEAKSFSTILRDHIPQAVAGMYGCAKALKKDVIRGALTSGDKWMFFVLVINDNGDGAKYWQSVELSFLSRLGTRATIEAPWPDIVAGILAHWTRNGFANIANGDDWFNVDTWSSGGE